MAKAPAQGRRRAQGTRQEGAAKCTRQEGRGEGTRYAELHP